MSEQEIKAELHALSEEHIKALVKIANLQRCLKESEEAKKNLLIKVRELMQECKQKPSS